MWVVNDEWRNPIDFGHMVVGQGQLCPPARGCHALRCLVCMLFCMNRVAISYYINSTSTLRVHSMSYTLNIYRG